MSSWAFRSLSLLNHSHTTRRRRGGEGPEAAAEAVLSECPLFLCSLGAGSVTIRCHAYLPSDSLSLSMWIILVQKSSMGCDLTVFHKFAGTVRIIRPRQARAADGPNSISRRPFGPRTHCAHFEP